MKKVVKFAWRGQIKKGKIEEYKKRHQEIWPSMVKVLKTAGIKNYSIWLDKDEVFGYYECEKGLDYAFKVQNASKIVAKWNDSMKDILIMKKKNKQESQPSLLQVFDLK